MPIYEYVCSNCAHTLSKLQKFSDEPLVLCPECNKKTLSKKLSSAGFALKGTGWYVTDFKNPPKKREQSGSPESSAESSSDNAAKTSAQDNTSSANANSDSTSIEKGSSSSDKASAKQHLSSGKSS